jgi:multisubunit Na+/H+ antiporter MnhC subunit
MGAYVFEAIILFIGILLVIAGCYCLVRTYHMLKIILAIEIAMKACTLFIVIAGYLNGNIDLAQAYIITIILIEVVVVVVAAGISINLYKTYGSMDIRNLRKLKG